MRSLSFFVGLFLVGSCAERQPTVLTPAPAAISILDGDKQSARVTELVSKAPSVKVVDANGLPVANASVTFWLPANAGSLSATTDLWERVVTTSSVGLAVVPAWRLGTNAGTQTLIAQIGADTKVTFVAQATAGPPAKIQVNSGDGQSAVMGTALPVRPSVAVTDQYGNRAASGSVTFSVIFGGGSIRNASQLSDSSGIATAGVWVLGDRALTPVNRFDTLGARLDITGEVVKFAATSKYPQVAPVQAWSKTNFEYPNSTPRYFGIWGSSSSNVWAVGRASVASTSGDNILRFSGVTWESFSNPITDPLNAVWGSGASNVIAVGDNGTIAQFDGITWRKVVSPTSASLRGVWGTSASDIYAVGDNGTVLRYDGASWLKVSINTSANLNGVWGTSASDVFVVGASGFIGHYNGTAWTVMSSGTVLDLYGIWGYGRDEIIAVGARRIILRFYGSTWSTQQVGSSTDVTAFRSARGTAPSDTYIAYIKDVIGVTPVEAAGLIKIDLSGSSVEGATPPSVVESLGAVGEQATWVSNPWGLAGGDIWLATWVRPRRLGYIHPGTSAIHRGIR